MAGTARNAWTYCHPCSTFSTNPYDTNTARTNPESTHTVLNMMSFPLFESWANSPIRIFTTVPLTPTANPDINLPIYNNAKFPDPVHSAPTIYIKLFHIMVGLLPYLSMGLEPAKHPIQAPTNTNEEATCISATIHINNEYK